jgi:pSer/pThr/pTyr-binding forkhead associated (FHA) protein
MFALIAAQSEPAVTVAAPIQSPPAVAAPAAIEPVVTDPPASTTVDVQVSNNEFIGWDALLSIDPTLYTDPDPDIPLPTDPDRTFPLDLADNLIGRRSDRLDIHPEINVNDPGVSHRHAKLLREENGKLLLLDLSSTNGTQLNGANILPGVRTPVANGDQITIGTWTKIVIHGRRP